MKDESNLVAMGVERKAVVKLKVLQTTGPQCTADSTWGVGRGQAKGEGGDETEQQVKKGGRVVGTGARTERTDKGQV